MMKRRGQERIIRAAFSNRGHLSARRKDAVLTAISAVMHCVFFRRKIMKKSLLQKLGLLGVVSFLSYTAAVVFAPLGLSRLQLDGAGGQRPERRQRAVAGAVESAQRPLQRVRGRLRDGCLHRHPGAEDQAAARGRLSVRRHGVDLGGRLPDVPAARAAATRARFRM